MLEELALYDNNQISPIKKIIILNFNSSLVSSLHWKHLKQLRFQGILKYLRKYTYRLHFNNITQYFIRIGNDKDKSSKLLCPINVTVSKRSTENLWHVEMSLFPCLWHVLLNDFNMFKAFSNFVFYFWGLTLAFYCLSKFWILLVELQKSEFLVMYTKPGHYFVCTLVLNW